MVREKKPKKIPILFLIYNRAELTKKVFASISKYKPDRLFIVADGPKPGHDKRLCDLARKVTEKVNWKCDVGRLYRTKNLGCGVGVARAIDWFFENVSEGIILEDDCLPNASFFKFCEIMLAKYRNNKEVAMVSGDNFQEPDKQINDSYYFSKFNHSWGWATWKRVWKLFDYNLDIWPKMKRAKFFDKYTSGLVERLYWSTLFDAVYKGKIAAWDYPFTFRVWSSGMKCILPGTNLVTNVGMGKEASNTKFFNVTYPAFDMKFPLKHPINTTISFDLDLNENRSLFHINLFTLAYLKIKFALSFKTYPKYA